MEPLRQDHVTLLAIDAERSLQGLLHSLSMGVNGMPKGALHATDLVSALASVGLAGPSHLMQKVAQALAAGQPLVLEIAGEFTHWLELKLQEIRVGNALDLALIDTHVMGWTKQLQALPSRSALASDNFAGEIQGLPFEAPVPAISANSFPLQAFQKNGIDLLQYARVLNSDPTNERSIQRIDNLLSELQDRCLQIGQKPLRELYDQHHSEVDECWLDADVFQTLVAFRSLSDRTQHIKAVQRNLTLWLDWQGVVLDENELDNLSKALSNAHGHLIHLNNGYRLTLPCSQRRMWLQPYQSEGRIFVISAAQVLEDLPPHNEKNNTLKVCAGLKKFEIPTDGLQAQTSMNIHPIPNNLPRPPGVTAVALNGKGDVFLFRSLGE